MGFSDFSGSEAEAGPSRLSDSASQGFSEKESDGFSEEGSTFEDEEELEDGLGEGMDPEGFSAPAEKVVKPLTKEALASFKAEQEKAGVIYISRIPPGMRPPKVRHLMSAYGKVGRVYLQQEGAYILHQN
jgi:ESF2/ABP1 family protein